MQETTEYFPMVASEVPPESSVGCDGGGWRSRGVFKSVRRGPEASFQTGTWLASSPSFFMPWLSYIQAFAHAVPSAQNILPVSSTSWCMFILKFLCLDQLQDTSLSSQSRAGAQPGAEETTGSSILRSVVRGEGGEDSA